MWVMTSTEVLGYSQCLPTGDARPAIAEKCANSIPGLSTSQGAHCRPGDLTGRFTRALLDIFLNRGHRRQRFLADFANAIQTLAQKPGQLTGIADFFRVRRGGEELGLLDDLEQH